MTMAGTLFLYVVTVFMAGTPPSSPKSSGSEEPRAASVEEVASTPPRTVTRGRSSPTEDSPPRAIVRVPASARTPPTPSRSITTALSSTTPPPQFAKGGTSCGASSSCALTPSKRKVNCPICGRNMHHEKAFCGHIRWHTQEERDAKSGEIQETLALSRQVEEAVEIAKKIKIPDLNKLPQPEDDDDAAGA
ncbi:cell division cycle protein 48 [Tanacetum coccineum]